MQLARQEFTRACGQKCNGQSSVMGYLMLGVLCYNAQQYKDALTLCVLGAGGMLCMRCAVLTDILCTLQAVGCGWVLLLRGQGTLRHAVQASFKQGPYCVL